MIEKEAEMEPDEGRDWWWGNIGINIAFMPFLWKLDLIWESEAKCVSIDIGPFMVSFGWA